MYYIYELHNPLTNEIFYVGYSNYERKTKRLRPSDHILEAQRGGKSLKCNIINKILSNNKDIIIKITYKSQYLTEILDEEQRLIKLYGRRDINTGTLANHTFGGTGGDTIKGLSNTKLLEQGKKISDGHKNRSPEAKLKTAQLRSISQSARWASSNRQQWADNIKKGINEKRDKKQHAMNVSNGHKNRSPEAKLKTSRKKSRLTTQQWKNNDIMQSNLQKTHENNCKSCIIVDVITKKQMVINNPNQWCKKYCIENNYNYNTIYSHLRKIINGQTPPKRSPLKDFIILKFIQQSRLKI